jgi:DNA-binding MarR family transcriptional regulator
MQSNEQSPIEPIVCLARRFEAIGNKYVFQPMGLSSTSVQILKLLNARGELTASDLIKITSATKSNISQRLSFLEKEHYIEKTTSSDITDKRKILIKLTSIGKEKITELEKRIKKAQISFEKQFTDEELNQHKAFFKKLANILDKGESELNKIFKF